MFLDLYYLCLSWGINYGLPLSQKVVCSHRLWCDICDLYTSSWRQAPVCSSSCQQSRRFRVSITVRLLFELHNQGIFDTPPCDKWNFLATDLKTQEVDLEMSSVKGDFLSFDDEIIAAESASVSSTKEESIERWRASEPPEELFTEAEQDAEWQYDIIGEEVDENGNLL